MSKDFRETIKFKLEKEPTDTPKDIFRKVFKALEEKGYDPINQLVGYFISGDPTYITSHQNARAIIRRLERDELLEELVRFYMENNDLNG
ncbi:MAG TPA: IreB family regulatory phosphoprotein [Candidatus Atribacteria bacterium]|nr:IreB family regulatory phosphoprotein [Candidatus Atribacteria bacterium]HPT79015.1 IreB family regulatory phosphoprotein [Candidatus Atribacteria bacterium]